VSSNLGNGDIGVYDSRYSVHQGKTGKTESSHSRMVGSSLSPAIVC